MSDDNFHFPDENDDDSEIWDEHRWEAHFQESDRASEKYRKLLEKYMDHPDRDEIIEREMGWEDSKEDERWVDEINKMLEEYEEDQKAESWKKDAGLEDKSDWFDELENNPVYQTAFNFGTESHLLLKEKKVDYNNESVLIFMSSSIIPAAKIAGGHALGFSPETLGGNIANCKRGLAEANKALEALQQMREENILDETPCLKLSRDCKRMRDDLAMYILDLREMFNRG